MHQDTHSGVGYDQRQVSIPTDPFDTGSKISVAFESDDKMEGSWDSTGLILMFLSNTVTYRRLNKSVACRRCKRGR
jgi:hypothetical protein